MVTDREQQIQQSWQANAAAWTQAVRHGHIPSRRLATDAAIIEALQRHQVQSVLDVGCGEGWLARALSKRGIEVVGVDGSSALIDRAREQGGGTFSVLTYEQIASDPKALDGMYDGIVCNFSLVGEEISPLLRALGGRLTEKGSLFIQTVHPFTACEENAYRDGWRVETFESFGGTFPAPMPWYFRTLSSWFSQITTAGLRVNVCEEPLHPETQRPLSLLLICQ